MRASSNALEAAERCVMAQLAEYYDMDMKDSPVALGWIQAVALALDDFAKSEEKPHE